MVLTVSTRSLISSSPLVRTSVCRSPVDTASIAPAASCNPRATIRDSQKAPAIAISKAKPAVTSNVRRAASYSTCVDSSAATICARA